MEQLWTVTVYWKSGSEPHVHKRQTAEQVKQYERLKQKNSDVIASVKVKKEPHLKIVK
jgi:hypothetical protein